MLTTPSHVMSGGGTEMPANYPQWNVEHAKFDPPAALHTSLTKLIDGGFLENHNWAGPSHPGCT